MRFHVSTLIGLALVFPLSLASCGEMELPTAPLEKEEASDSEAANSEATVPEVSPSGKDSPTSNDHIPPPSEAIIVATLPIPCSIWRDHVVALTTPIDKTNTPEALVTLISLYDWPEVPSALNESSSTVAATIAQGYQEYELTNWRIPTAAEAKALKAAYTPPQSKSPVLEGSAFESTPPQSKSPVLEGSAFKSTPPQSKGPVLGGSAFESTPPQSREAVLEGSAFNSTPSQTSGPVLEGSAFESLNALLRTLEASELHLTEGATNARYLCEDATRTFSFAPNTTISTAGTKTTNYRLRLVKTLRLKQKQ